MASLNFPTAPADQQTYSANGITYQYNAAKSRWDIVPPTVKFETSAQLDLRDTANRSRSNHTGTQTASTISDFDTEVSNNTDVAANTSARHDAVTVADSSEIDFTLTGQQITASIVAGSIDESKLDASVNASLDLADSSVQLTGNQSIAGTKTFTTALILPNNSRVNGVEHFYQPGPTTPTVRGDGSALVSGDRWWNTTDGTEWFWNGTYWLGEKTYAKFFNNGNAIVNNRSMGGNATFSPASATGDVFVESLTVWGFVPTTNDATNKWEIRVSTIVPSAITSPTLTAFFDSTVWGASSSSSPGVTVINELINVDYPIQSFALGLTKVGSPGNLTLSGAYILYRPVA